jgi:hypothetical protein
MGKKNQGFVSVIFIMLIFLFIIVESYYLLIIKTQNLAFQTLKRMEISTEIFKAHYAKLKNQKGQAQIQNNLITVWGERQIITPGKFDGNKWIYVYEETYIK